MYILYNCIPIQRTIAALKLKNSVERETLNDMHMKAIKVIELSMNTQQYVITLYTTSLTIVLQSYKCACFRTCFGCTNFVTTGNGAVRFCTYKW